MTYVELEAEGLIRKTRMDPKRVTDSLELARRDIETARSVLDHSHDWAYNIAYNAMLQSSRALMFSLGYRPAGRAQHISVVRFARAALGEEFEETVILFDRMRRNRNLSVYDTPGTISETQAKDAIERAVELLSVIEERVE